MKYLRFVLVLSASVPAIGWAQDEERRAPPIEIPDFSNLDDYIYEPKSTVVLGFRYLGGAKTSFSGQGRIAGANDPGPATGANLERRYHDGGVGADLRSVPRLDNSGNPVIDPQSGVGVSDPIAPDGRTNNWGYSDSRQLVDGYLAFHSYSAQITDTDVRTEKPGSTLGLELAVMRDMGKLLGTRMSWSLTAGMSINDISSDRTDKVRADLTTLTDYYSLFGQSPPTAPYSSPSSTTQSVVDANGNPVLNPDGSSQTVNVDTSILISSEPLGRTITTLSDSTSVTNRWKVKGAYYTFRAGPTVWLPITAKFRISVSLGAALVFAGTNYSVLESFTPEIGAELLESNESDAYKLLPGYYADATLQYDLTDRAGFYAGAIFQSTGSYDHSLESANAQYVTKVDLANQSGLRAGMTIRF